MPVTLPNASLQQGTWFKLICGASFHHLPSVRELAFLYTLAGVDCIDLAADPAIVRAAQQGIQWAQAEDPQVGSPWLMVSVNDGEDVHFRKAVLTDPVCPVDCPQPCVAVCPPHALVPLATSGTVHLQTELCYGCGRCEPVCPYHRIATPNHQVPLPQVLPSLVGLGIQAVEIHTRIGRQAQFGQLWGSLRPWLPHLEALSISFNDGPGLEAYLRDLLSLMDPRPKVLIWQVDGRPMSGDIGSGSGTSKATLKLAHKVLNMGLPGYVQLAGGTNAQTVLLLDPRWPVAGLAFGSYARQLVASYLEGGLAAGIPLAKELVAQVKQRPVTVVPGLQQTSFSYV
ncbi:4Fe-4S binding protein [Synechococcus bigranulatus str. 'Rupite']|uniref:4Fe-4S binding protein n=1 Tax=Thermostichus vulcanus str. 'Rupite' TaxID=2813851 RepID=A0ABT0CF81_THEVL|nr:4Fe-4S binding protein [Thermostichus vulcanus str. 'Rupite']